MFIYLINIFKIIESRKERITSSYDLQCAIKGRFIIIKEKSGTLTFKTSFNNYFEK